MELFLLYLTAFLRPIFFIEIGSQNLFDVGAIGLTGALGLALLVRGATARSLRLGPIDFLGIGFALWCAAAYVIYLDNSSLRELARLVIPVLTFTMAANALRHVEDFRTMLRLLLAGLSIPIFLSVGVIAAGGGMEPPEAHYYTGAIRWEGVYDGPHSLGHNAAFFLFTAALYLGVCRSIARSPSKWEWRFLAMTALAALFCIAMSQVRTVILGVVIFCGVFLYFQNKKRLILLAGIGTAAFALAFPFIKPYLFPELVMAELGVSDLSYIGSGRLYIWTASLSQFASLPLDQKLAGYGVGQFIDVFGTELRSHSDYLDLLISTGAVGLFLYVTRELLIFRAVLALGNDGVRHLMLGIFLSVVAMNVVSVSYIGRFGLAQMYSMLLVFVVVAASRRKRAPAHGASAREAAPVPVARRRSARQAPM